MGLELGLAFADACRESTPHAYDLLRRATIALVGALKFEGTPPERVIVAFKNAIARYGHSHTYPSLSSVSTVDGDEFAAAYRRAFSWCLEAYYEGT